MANKTADTRTGCQLCSGAMDSVLAGEHSVFKCRDCGTTVIIPHEAWNVAASKRTAAIAGPPME